MPTATPSNSTDSVDPGRKARAILTVAILLFLSLTVLLLRFYRLSELPPGIQNDEGANGVDALRVLQGEHAIFFPERATGHEAVGVYAIALTTAILGRTLLAFHLPMALASAGTVFTVFWLGLLLFGRDEESGNATSWRGLLVGAIAAGLTAVSLSQTFLSRAGLRANFLPLVLSLSLALLWWAWNQEKSRIGSRWKLALAGGCAGLLPHTYLAARFTPLLYVLFGLSFVFLGRTPGTVKEQARLLRRHLPQVGLFVGLAGLVAAPLLIYFALNPQDFTIRSGSLWLFHEGQANPFGAFLRNAWEHILVLGFRGDQHQRYNFAGQPMLNPWQAFFFWLGVGLAVYRWKRSPANRLLLLWQLVLILPAMLADTKGQGPNSLRMIGAAPATYLLIGSGIWEAYRLLWTRRLAIKWRQKPILPDSETTFASVGATIVVGLILAQGVATFRAFFVLYAGTAAFDRAYHAEWAEAARALNAQQSNENAVHILPYPRHNEHFGNEHYGFEYLYLGHAPVHIVAAITPHNLAQKVERALAAGNDFSTVNFVDWNNELVGGDARSEAHVLALLGRYGLPSTIEDYSNFRIHSFKSASFDRPWKLYSGLQPMDVNFDKGISLRAFTLGQAEEQLSMRQGVHIGSPGPLWVALMWETAPGLSIDFAVSFRLHDTAGEAVLQEDFVLTNSVSKPTSRWNAGKPVDSLFYLEATHELPPGEYELRLVVYDFKTWEPTVELGVWKPESKLTHLRLVASD